MGKILALILLLFAPAAALAASGADSEPVLLLDGVTAFTPLDASTVLVANADGELRRVDTDTRQARPWSCDWQPAGDGWSELGRIVVLSTSPDGQWVCLAREVGADAKLLAQRAGDAEPLGNLRGFEHLWAVAILLCRVDGSGARLVGLGVEAGGGPDYDFTMDSSRLVGQPFLPCLPDALSCYKYMSRIWEVLPIPQFNCVDVSTGERGLLPDLPVSDGYWKCPYSDNFRAENNWYDEHQFSTFDGGGILGQYSCPPPEGYGRMHGWVLPDAVLLSQADGQGLLYIDGTYHPAPTAGWEVYCWLDDGSYLFSDDGGQSIKYGKVDWPTFSVDWYVTLPALAVLQDAAWAGLPGAAAALAFRWDTGELWYVPLSRAGSKP
jgi:hypothetical protein